MFKFAVNKGFLAYQYYNFFGPPTGPLQVSKVVEGLKLWCEGIKPTLIIVPESVGLAAFWVELMPEQLQLFIIIVLCFTEPGNS